jgi:hypothetical protein
MWTDGFWPTGPSTSWWEIAGTLEKRAEEHDVSIQDTESHQSVIV